VILPSHCGWLSFRRVFPGLDIPPRWGLTRVGMMGGGVRLGKEKCGGLKVRVIESTLSLIKCIYVYINTYITNKE
jgi:hypothetical protein